jgi:hypothetical protein
MSYKKVLNLIFALFVLMLAVSCGERSSGVPAPVSMETPSASGQADSSPALSAAPSPIDTIGTTTDNAVSPSGGIANVKDITLKDLPDTVYDPTDRHPGCVYLLAELRENNIMLYGYDEPDTYKPHVILRIDDALHFYNWDYMTPRSIPPVLTYADFDSDGRKELAIVLYVGSGTGYAVEDLRIIEFGIGGSQVDYYLSPDVYMKYLEGKLSYSVDTDNNVLIRQGNGSINCGQIETGDCGRLMGLGFGDIVHFTAENEKMNGVFAIGLIYENRATSVFVGQAAIDISFSDGHFDMGNIKLTPID